MKSILEDVGKTCILAKTPFSIKVVRAHQSGEYGKRWEKTCILAKTPFSIKVVGGTLGISRVVNMAKYRVFDIGQ